MKLRSVESNNKIYSKIFLYLTTSISVTIFILSAIFYVNFSNISLSIINSYIKDSLSQISYSATFMTFSAKTMAKQLYSDSNITYLLNNLNPDYPQLSVSLDRLSAYKSSSPFIQSIYVFNSRTDTFYSTLDNGVESKAAFSDQSVLDILEDPGKYNMQNPIPRIIPAKSHDEKPSNVYSFVLNDFPANPDKMASSIILNISAEWIRDIMTSMEINNEGDIFIIDAQGRIINNAHNTALLTDVSGEKYIKQVLSAQMNSGVFLSDINGVRSLVTYVSSDTIGWKFIRLTPYQNIVSKIDKMRYLTIIVGILILLCGLFSSLFISRRLYKPIDRMVVKISKLESEKRNRFYEVKQEFLRKILHDGLHQKSQDIQTNFLDLNIPITVESEIVLVLLKIDHFADFCNRFTTSDRSLYKFSLINIASELFSESFTPEGIDAGDDHIVLILARKNDDFDTANASIDPIIRRLQAVVSEHLQFSFTSAVTSRGIMANDLKFLYDQASNYIHHRMFHGHGSILHVNEIIANIDPNYTYPIGKEKELIEALMVGKTDSAKNLYHEIITQTLNCSHNILNLTLLRLLTAINIAVDSLEKDVDLATPYKFSGFTSLLSSLETLKEVEEQFYMMFDQIIENINARIDYKKSAKYNSLVNRIMEKVRDSYTDKNLSLDSIADSVNLSSIYLGRLFKKITSKSVSDYINEIRLEKAKEFLTTTDISVNEIVDAIGFSNSGYFYAAFKKATGVTPNVYRQCTSKIQEDPK